MKIHELAKIDSLAFLAIEVAKRNFADEIRILQETRIHYLMVKLGLTAEQVKEVWYR